MSGREWIAAAEDGGLLQLAGGHGGLRHADGLSDAGDLRCEAVIDAEGEGLVALQLPLEAFEAFAGDAFVAVVFWSEADELGRVLIFGYVLLLQDGAGGFEDAGEAAVLLHLAAVGDEVAGGGHGFAPGAAIKILFVIPLCSIGEHLVVKTSEHGHVLDAAWFEVFLFFEAGGVFRGQEWRGTFGELGGAEAGLHGVVVMRGHGIELVIVAAGALQRMCEEGFADAVGDVIEEALAGDFGDLHAGEFPGSHAEEAGGDEAFGI